MELPRIQIRTTPMKIGMRSQRAELQIDQGNPITLDLQTRPGKLEMHTEHVKVEIDQSRCFEESGLMSNASLIADAASLGKQKAMEGLARIVDQGNQMAAIENGRDPIPDQAEYNAFDQFIREWNMVTMPRSGPEFKVTGGTVDIHYEPGELINDTQKSKVKFNYKQAKLDIYVEQYNSIEMSVINLRG